MPSKKLSFFFLSLSLASCNISQKQCNGINWGIKTEYVQHYKLSDQDTILTASSTLFFNPRGWATKATYISKISKDTQSTIMEYAGSKLLCFREYYNEGDSSIRSATAWNPCGRPLRVENMDDSSSYTLYTYQDNLTKSQKTYSAGELVYSRELKWKDRRLQSTLSRFYGSTAEAIGKARDSTSSNYLDFDQKGNWTKRLVERDGATFYEVRRLEYY